MLILESYLARLADARVLQQLNYKNLPWHFARPTTSVNSDDHCMVTNSSATVGCKAMVRSKSALVAPMLTATAAI